MNQIACSLIGRDPAEVQVVPLAAIQPAYAGLDAQTRAAGVEHGVPLVHTAEFQARQAVSDPAQTLPVLHVEPDDVVAAVTESLRWCVDHPVAGVAATH